MEGSLKIDLGEFNIQLFEKLQRIFQTIGPHEITISFSDTRETISERKNRFLTAKQNLAKAWHGLIKSEDWRNVAPCTANQYPIANQPTPKPRTADQSMPKMG
jgi:hypothetical protein